MKTKRLQLSRDTIKMLSGPSVDRVAAAGPDGGADDDPTDPMITATATTLPTYPPMCPSIVVCTTITVIECPTICSPCPSVTCVTDACPIV